MKSLKERLILSIGTKDSISKSFFMKNDYKELLEIIENGKISDSICTAFRAVTLDIYPKNINTINIIFNKINLSLLNEDYLDYNWFVGNFHYFLNHYDKQLIYFYIKNNEDKIINILINLLKNSQNDEYKLVTLFLINYNNFYQSEILYDELKNIKVKGILKILNNRIMQNHKDYKSFYSNNFKHIL
jgi:hypothetical protein